MTDTPADPTKPAQTKVLSAEEQRACWTAILTNGEIRNDSPLLPNEHTAAADAITLLQGHIAVLTEQVRVLREALNFYADDAVYIQTKDDPERLNPIQADYYGDRARRALAALEGRGDQP